MLDDKTRALLGDREAQEAFTARGELLVCQVCGKQPELKHNGPQIDHGNRFLDDKCDFFTAWAVKCKCGHVINGYITQYQINTDGTVSMVGDRDGRKEAIQNWNTRPPLLTPTQMAALERETRKFEEGIK